MIIGNCTQTAFNNIKLENCYVISYGEDVLSYEARYTTSTQGIIKDICEVSHFSQSITPSKDWISFVVSPNPELQGEEMSLDQGHYNIRMKGNGSIVIIDLKHIDSDGAFKWLSQTDITTNPEMLNVSIGENQGLFLTYGAKLEIEKLD